MKDRVGKGDRLWNIFIWYDVIMVFFIVVLVVCILLILLLV